MFFIIKWGVSCQWFWKEAREEVGTIAQLCKHFIYIYIYIVRSFVLIIDILFSRATEPNDT